MSGDIIQPKALRLHRGRGLSPAEVLIHSLCDGQRTSEDIFKKVVDEIKELNNPREEFNLCLEALKKRGLIAYIIIFLLCHVIMSPALMAQERHSIVVAPVHDNVSDEKSFELADLFSKTLTAKGFDVISRDKVEAVLGYYQETKVNNDAEDALIRAKEHYYNFEYDEAISQAIKAINIMEAAPEKISEHGELLRDAYIVAAIVEKSQKGHEGDAKKYFRRALIIDPHFQLNEKAFSPSMVELFNSVKKDVSAFPAGTINIDTDPKVAEVYINGILKGVTPLNISGLPEGSYRILIKTNKYRPVEKQVIINAGGVSKIRQKLWWEGGIQNLLTSKETARDEIKEGIRISGLLRAQKVVMLDADEDAHGSGEIAIRMIDGEYKAGHNPIIIRYAAARKTLASDLNVAASELASQARADIIKNSQRHIDPDGIGDPVLLGSRGREFISVPAFWAVVGGALAASAGGAAAAVAMDGGGGPATGSVSVQFK